MDGNEVIDLARKTYVEALAGFVVAQGPRFPKGEAEVPTHRPPPTPFFGGHYRVDFIGQGPNGLIPLDLLPETRLRINPPIRGSANAMQVSMETVVWDDIAIVHDIPGDMTPVLKPWFDLWYDLDESRARAAPGRLPDVIHWVQVTPGRLVIDFGSASVGAFWSLMATLRDAGATAITICDTRPPLPPARQN